MKNLKDTVTNIIALVVGIGTLTQTALGNIPQDAERYVWAGSVVITIIAYLTGKGPNGKKLTL